MSRFDRYQLQLVYPTVEHRSARIANFTNLLTHSISQNTSIHCTNLFLHFSCIFTSLEIIKHNMSKIFSSILKVKVKSLSRARLFTTPWTVACTKLLRLWDFSRQECWSGSQFPSPRNLPNPGIEPRSPAL